MTEASSTYGQANGHGDPLDNAARAYAAEGAHDADRLGADVLGRGTAADGITTALTQLSDEIEARPEIAFGIAAVAGLLLGLALGRPARAIVYIKD